MNFDRLINLKTWTILSVLEVVILVTMLSMMLKTPLTLWLKTWGGKSKTQLKKSKALSVSDYVQCDKLASADKLDLRLVGGLVVVILGLVLYFNALNNKLREIGNKSYKNTPTLSVGINQTLESTPTPFSVDWKGNDGN